MTTSPPPASPGVQAGNRAATLYPGFSVSIRCVLLLDVLLDDAKWRAAAGRGEVRRRPQDALPVAPNQGRMAQAHEAARHALEAVH